jgi:hypothetical protein
MTKPMTKAAMKAAAVREAKREAFGKRVRTLLGHMVGARLDTAALNAAFDAIPVNGDFGSVADAYAATVAAQEPVGRCLHGQKAEAITRARKEAEDMVARILAELEAVDWKINAVAPYPRSNMGQIAYQMARQKRSLRDMLTQSNAEHNGWRIRYDHADYLVEADAKGIARFIEQNEREAALQYDMFICKMVNKVGEVTDASITGTHIWGHSVLTVTLPNGTVERWKTQQIVNQSKLGLLFNQWPSRKMKG